MRPVKMIAMDFDSTLIDHRDGGKYIPRATVDLLCALVAQGIPCGIDSGRQPEALLDTLRLAGVAPGKPFPSFFMEQENFVFWNEGHPDPDDFYFWDKEGLYAAQADNAALRARIDAFCRRIAGRIPAIMALMERERLFITHWILFSTYGIELHFDAIDAAQKAIELLREYLPPEENAALHRNTSIVNIVPSFSGKGASLLRASQAKGIRPQNVLAIGDSLNDMTMLSGEYGFQSACVGNADGLVKEAVRKNGGYVATGRAGEGVYEILHMFALGGALQPQKGQ
ncbi:MAG: HAD family hydrolase [Eubacteriales bacterium]|nr:HAD family hydrolase [Eubacteriales bacterium]